MELYKNYEISAMSLAQAKKEYQRMRKIALKRLSRLEKDNRADYIEDIPTLRRSSEMSANEIYNELMEVNRFLKNPFTLINKVKAYEKYMIERFQESGYDFVTTRNIKDINRLMGIIRNAVGDKAFESDEALEYIEQLERLNVNPDDFAKRVDEYLQYSPDQLEQLNPIRTGREMKFIDVKRRIEKYDL